MKNSILSLALLACSIFGYSQSLENDPSVLYMKANVLYDSGRYDEAVRMYNQVLNENKNYTQAILQRAKAKYELGAYSGTKKDILEYISTEGVTKAVIRVMSKTELELGNLSAAQNYTDTALELDPYDAEQYRIAGSIQLKLKNKNDACEYFGKASKLKDTKAGRLLEEHCGIRMNTPSTREKVEVVTGRKERVDVPQLGKPDSRVSNEREEIKVEDLDGNLNRKPSMGDVDITPEQEPIIQDQDDNYVDLEAYQEIEIDDAITVVIGNGLGKRKVDNVPNIMMGSSQSGKVVIDICVDDAGKVTKAEFNKPFSDLKSGGVVSLALRKAKDFAFYPSFREEQCGYIIFDIR